MRAFLACIVASMSACAAELPGDFWFCADFDEPAELCGNAFLRALPEGDGVKSAGLVKGRFGRGYAFLGPTNRCEGIFWREQRPEAFADFPWKDGSFVCWYRTPESVPTDAPGRAFGVGDFRFGLDQSRIFSCASGWLQMPSGMRSHDWHHIALVWNAEGFRIYRDGAEIAFKKGAKGIDPFANGKFDLQVGTGGYASMAANLEMDEIAVFRHALTPDEVAAVASAKTPLRAGREKLLATPVSLPVYPRNSKNAALRFRVSSPKSFVCRVSGDVDGKPLACSEVTVGKGVSDLDIPFDAVRHRPGKYPWRFTLTDASGRTVLSRSGSLTISKRFDRDAYKVLSWGGYRDLSAAEMVELGVNAANLHHDRAHHYALQRELAENGMHLSMRVVNWRMYAPCDFDEGAIRRNVLSSLDHLRGLDNWTMSLMNTEMYGTGTTPIWEAAKSPRWRAFAEKSLPHGLPPTNRFTRAPAQIAWKAFGREPPSGVLGDCEPEIEALLWYYRDGHMLYLGNKMSMAEIRLLSPGNVCWAEPIIETWNIAAHHDETCDWIYNVWSHETLACARGQQAWVRGAGKPYMPLLSMAYEHNKKFFRENPNITGRDGKPARIFPCRTADDLAISCWQTVGAVPCHDFGFFAIDSWGVGAENVRKSGRDISKLQGLVAEPEDQPKFAAFFKSAFLPAAELLRDMPNARAPVAVLQPVEARYMGGWPVSVHHQRICHEIGKTGVPYDVIPDAEVTREVLSRYRFVILPMMQVVSRAHYEVLSSLPETTTLVVDSHCPKSLFPRAVRLDAKFDWLRWDETAGRAFARWFKTVEGGLRESLAAKSDEDGEFSAQTFHKEYRGARYVMVVNDRRERRDSIMTQCMTNEWYRPYGAPQKITTHLPFFPGGAGYVFNMKNARGRHFGKETVTLPYAAAEARLFCLYPAPLAAPALKVDGEALQVSIRDVQGRPAPGRQIVEVTVLDETGAERDESGRYAVEGGVCRVPLYIADADRAGFASGKWRYAVRDSTTGLEAEL